jgi:hypothetical protein
MACTDTIVTDNIDYCPEDENPSGVSPVEIYAARVSDFENLIAPPLLSVATTLADAATIAGPHTFPTGKGFFKINILPDTGLVETANEGEKGSKSNANSFAGTLPGTGAKVGGFIRKYQNVGMVFLVTQVNGDIKQIGSKISPAYLSEASGSTGQAVGDVHGTPIRFTDVQAYPAPVYTGAITEFTPV